MRIYLIKNRLSGEIYKDEVDGVPEFHRKQDAKPLRDVLNRGNKEKPWHLTPLTRIGIDI